MKESIVGVCIRLRGLLSQGATLGGIRDRYLLSNSSGNQKSEIDVT